MKNKTYQNFWDVANCAEREIYSIKCLKKTDFQTISLKKPEKEQIKPRISRRNKITEQNIYEIKNRKTIESIKPIAGSQKDQNNNARNKEREFTTDYKNIKRMRKYEQIYNLDEMGKYLDINYQSSLKTKQTSY